MYKDVFRRVGGRWHFAARTLKRDLAPSAAT
jgi:hypothetical protein